MDHPHTDTLPPAPPLPPLGTPALPYAPVAPPPPPAPLTSDYLTALECLLLVARPVIANAVELHRVERDGAGEAVREAVGKNLEHWSRILLKMKELFYPNYLHADPTFFIPLPPSPSPSSSSPTLAQSRHSAALKINTALLLALLPGTPAAGISSKRDLVLFLAQLKETYLLLCAGRGKNELIWVSLDRLAEVCTALALAIKDLQPLRTGSLTYRLAFSHSHLHHPQLTPSVLEPKALARFESTWSTRALERVKQLCDAPPDLELDDALRTVRTALVADIVQGIVPHLGDYAPSASTSTPMPSPARAPPSPAKPQPQPQPKSVRPNFAWTAAQADAVRLTESESFAEPEEDELEDERPFKGARGRGKAVVKGTGKGKGKGKAGKTNGKGKGKETETATESTTETEDSQSEGPVPVPAPAPPAPQQQKQRVVLEVVLDAPRVRAQSTLSTDTLPDVEEVIQETQLGPATSQSRTPQAARGTKRPSEEDTPRPAKRRAVGQNATPGPSQTRLPEPKRFFPDTQEQEPAAAAPAAADVSVSHDEGEVAQLLSEDNDEVAEEGDEVAEEGDDAEQEQEQDGEQDQLRSSVPVPTPTPERRPPARPRSRAPSAGPSAPPPRKERKPALPLPSPSRPPPAQRAPNPPPPPTPRSKNRYATGGNQSGRKKWTAVEDSALLEALRDLHAAGGDHSRKWKLVLDWHGREGSRSTILRERNNAQLKDRARNLFLMYQKNGQQPPEFLPSK